MSHSAPSFSSSSGLYIPQQTGSLAQEEECVYTYQATILPSFSPSYSCTESETGVIGGNNQGEMDALACHRTDGHQSVIYLCIQQQAGSLTKLMDTATLAEV